MHPIQESNIAAFRADLHCHSFCSDGSNSPIELVDLALEKGLQGLSITDHDTIEAYQTAVPYAKEKGLLLGMGVEFSCTHKKESVHVLAYDFQLDHPDFLVYCKRQQDKRALRNLMILEKLRRLSLVIEESEILLHSPKSKVFGRPHIALVMVNKGYVRTIQEAFQLYLGDRKCCFVPGATFPVLEAVAVIHKAGGKVFLAHPHFYREGDFVKELLLLGFDGIECYYGRSLPYKQERWLETARNRGLLVSGGSDFHGVAKPHLELGCSYVSFDLFSMIFTSLVRLDGQKG